MDTYRAAIIGLTGIAAGAFQPAPDPVLGYAMPHSHAAAYATIPNTTVVAVCDIVPAMIERFRGSWGTTFPDARGYTDYREMLDKERVDILSVCTPDHLHADMVVDGVQAGVKGIFCEKPIATTLADADRIIGACQQRGVPLIVDHTRRWWPEFLETRRLVRAGAIGQLRRVFVSLGGKRAMLFRNGTHLIDSLCFFAESDPAWVVAELDDEHHAYGPRYNGDGGHDPATDPGGSGYVHFQNGVRGFVNCSKGSLGEFEVHLFGEDGIIRIGARTPEILRAVDGRTVIGEIRPPQTTKGALVAALEELIGLMEKGGDGSSTGADGRRAISILLGMLQSSASGGARVSFPVQDQ